MKASPQPWIEVAQLRPSADLEQSAPLDLSPGYEWQALFACQVCLRPFEDLLRLRWGFNAAFLLQEAMERQRLFVEAQHPGDPPLLLDWRQKRSLALRCQRRSEWPGNLLSLIGKVSAPSQEIARQAALNHWREIRSLFPYDYDLRPALSREAFRRLAGWEILSQAGEINGLAQVRRFEHPLQTGGETLLIGGVWQAAERSDEQIWRALAACAEPVLLNILLRPAALLENERRLLAALESAAQKASQEGNLAIFQPYAAWAAGLARRRSAPWARLFLAQVCLVSPAPLPEYLLRAVGSALTHAANPEQTLPGFQSLFPASQAEAAAWTPYLYWLETLPPNRVVPPGWERLQDMADLVEAQALFHFPYPPEAGLPGVTFLPPLEEAPSTGG